MWRTLVFLVLVAVSGLAGAVLAVVLLAAAHPGVKGPHITDDQFLAALFMGGAAGLAPWAVRWWWTRRQRGPRAW